MIRRVMNLFQSMVVMPLLALTWAVVPHSNYLNVSHFIEKRDGHTQVIIEMKRTKDLMLGHYERVLVKYTVDGVTPPSSKKEFSYFPKEEVWRVSLGEMQSNSQIHFTVGIGAKDNGDIRWGYNHFRGYSIDIPKELARLGRPQESLSVPRPLLDTSASSNDPVALGFPEAHNDDNNNKILNSSLRRSRLAPTREITRDAVVKEYLSRHKVYISMTTSPNRISKIPFVLRTLDLAWVDEILVVLPLRYGRDGSEYQIPEELRNFEKVKIIRIDKDLGPITKLIPGVEYAKELDPDSIVITIDDDIAYTKGMVPELILKVISSGGAVAGGKGPSLSFWNLSDFGFAKSFPASKSTEDKTPGKTHLEETPEKIPNDVIVEGWAGIAYLVKNVDTELMRHFTSKFRECFVSDDLVINYVLGFSGVPRVSVNNRYYSFLMLQPFPYGLGEDALHYGAGLKVASGSAGGDVNGGDVNSVKYFKCLNKIIETAFDFTALSLKSREQILKE